jgi:hypothetical protein
MQHVPSSQWPPQQSASVEQVPPPLCGGYVKLYDAVSGNELGLGVLATPEDGQIQTSGGSGFAVGAGLGYDWWVHRRWSLGVLARLTCAWPTTSTQYGDLMNVDNRIVSSAILFSVAFD